MAEEAVKKCFVSAGCTMTERSGKFSILYFRPNDGSNRRGTLRRASDLKDLTGGERPNDGSRTAIGSFKSQRRLFAVRPGQVMADLFGRDRKPGGPQSGSKAAPEGQTTASVQFEHY